jgi:hypothetical protein
MLHRLSKLSLLAVLGAAACGGSDDPTGPVPPTGPTTYTIDTRDQDGASTTALVAYQDGDRWIAATPTTPGVFTFTATSPTVAYATVCPPLPDDEFASTSIRFRYQARGEEGEVEAPCYRFRSDEVEPTTITVIPVGAGVGVKNSGTRGSAAETYDVHVPPGTSDVLAWTDRRILIDRGVAFPPPQPLILDVTARGSELERLPVTMPAGAADETVTASYSFRTAGAAMAFFEAIPAEVGAVGVVPAALRQSGDSHSLNVTATRGNGRRYTGTSDAGIEQLRRPLTLPEGFDDVTGTWVDATPEVRWRGRPDDDSDLFVSVDAYGEASRYWNAAFSSEYLEAIGGAIDGAWTLPDLSQVDGWQPAWSLTAADEPHTTWSLSADDFDPAGNTYSGTYWYASFTDAPASLRTAAEREREHRQAIARALR